MWTLFEFINENFFRGIRVLVILLLLGGGGEQVVLSPSTQMGEAGPHEVIADPSMCSLVGFPDLCLERTGTASAEG